MCFLPHSAEKKELMKLRQRTRSHLNQLISMYKWLPECACKKGPAGLGCIGLFHKVQAQHESNAHTRTHKYTTHTRTHARTHAHTPTHTSPTHYPTQSRSQAQMSHLLPPAFAPSSVFICTCERISMQVCSRQLYDRADLAPPRVRHAQHQRVWRDSGSGQPLEGRRQLQRIRLRR